MLNYSSDIQYDLVPAEWNKEYRKLYKGVNRHVPSKMRNVQLNKMWSIVYYDDIENDPHDIPLDIF